MLGLEIVEMILVFLICTVISSHLFAYFMLPGDETRHLA